jgi:MFS family permease
LLPTAQDIGIWAVVLLVLLRLLQGLGAGAELSGAMTLVAEYATPSKRGLWTSLVMAMPPAGSAVATLAFLAVAALPEENFYGWGWRLPFLASAVLFLVAIYIRTKLEESPDYKAAMDAKDEREKKAKTPLAELLRTQWREVILGFMAVTGHNANNYIISIASITIMVTYGGLERTTALAVVLLGSLIGILMSPVGGMAGDRFGAGKTMAFGALVGLFFAFPLFQALVSGNSLAAFAALAVSYGVVLACTSGAQGAFLANLFPTRTRFTGTALARETNGAIVAGLTPMIVTALFEVGNGSITYPALYMAGCFLVTFLGVTLAKGKGDNKVDTQVQTVPA